MIQIDVAVNKVSIRKDPPLILISRGKLLYSSIIHYVSLYDGAIL